jgi:hypothetical protein
MKVLEDFPVSARAFNRDDLVNLGASFVVAQAREGGYL